MPKQIITSPDAPTTGFTEAPVYDGDAADATQGPGIPANRRVIR